MVVVVVMLNLLVSLLNDLYEELKSLATADWCRAQVPTTNKTMNLRLLQQICLALLGVPMICGSRPKKSVPEDFPRLS